MAVLPWPAPLALVGSLIRCESMGFPEEVVCGRFKEVSICSSYSSYLEGPVEAAVEVSRLMALGCTLSFLSG